MNGWKSDRLIFDDLVKYLSDIESDIPFKSTYTPGWYIATEGTRFYSTSDYLWPKKSKRAPPVEDKIDEQKLNEIL